MLAHVRCNGTDAGAEQVRLGMACVFVRYAPADPPLYAIEEEARAARPGYGLSVSQCRRGSHVSANGGRLRATKKGARVIRSSSQLASASVRGPSSTGGVRTGAVCP